MYFDQISTALNTVSSDKLAVGFVKYSLLTTEIKRMHGDEYDEKSKPGTSSFALAITLKKDAVCLLLLWKKRSVKKRI